jgi:hypothetical protein
MSDYRNPGDIRALVALALQPSLVDLNGYDAQVARIASALTRDGVTARRIVNAIGDTDVVDDILAAIINLNANA